MDEEWRAIPGWEGVYEVSSLGRVRSMARTARIHLGARRTVRERYLRLSPSRGYLRFRASRPGHSVCLKVHVCVALAFLGPARGVVGSGADEWCVNHEDGNHSNNRKSNLEWTTGLSNRVHAGEMGLVTHGEQHHAAVLTIEHVREIRQMHASGAASQRTIAQAFGVSQSRVSLIVRRLQWKHVA